MRFEIEKKRTTYSVSVPLCNEYRDLTDAISRTDTEGMETVIITDFGGHTVAVWKPEMGWRVARNRWDDHFVSYTEWVPLEKYKG